MQVCVFIYQILFQKKITMKKIALIAFGLLCMLCSSCKPELCASCHIDDSIWIGELPGTAINGKTEAEVNVNREITLTFEDVGTICKLLIGMKDMLGTSQHLFETRWTSDRSFDLYPTVGEQLLKIGEGSIAGNKMKLQLYYFNEGEEIDIVLIRAN